MIDLGQLEVLDAERVLVELLGERLILRDGEAGAIRSLRIRREAGILSFSCRRCTSEPPHRVILRRGGIDTGDGEALGWWVHQHSHEAPS